MALEALVTETKVLPEGWEVRPDATHGANLFHGTLSAAVAQWAEWLAPERVLTVVLSGGCFYNKVLARDLESWLEMAGLRVMHPRRLGPGDTAVTASQPVRRVHHDG